MSLFYKVAVRLFHKKEANAVTDFLANMATLLT